MSGNEEKAARYTGLLDAARCNGAWNEVPELVRKVKKHAPQKKLLTTTAVCELEAAKTASRLGNSSADSPIPNPPNAQELRSVLAAEGRDSPNIIEAQVCLAWIYWLAGDLENVLATLQADSIALLQARRDLGQGSQDWTSISLIKATYFRVSSSILLGQRSEVQKAWVALQSFLGEHKTELHENLQLSYWTEQLLARLAVTFAEFPHLASSPSDGIRQTLKIFRKWSTFAAVGQDVSAARYGNTAAHLSRSTVWLTDYKFVSKLLRSGQSYADGDGIEPKQVQINELRRVEAMTEKELLASTHFPHATESNVFVEEWVEEVLQNWVILWSDEWHDGDFGQGGRDGFGRNVLDILYRAAARTFHSTLILRRLFQVHKALADFDLAYKALDTYLELMERAKTRAAKSNEPLKGQDSADNMLRTLAEGVEGLTAYGGRDEAEKAHQLSETMAQWLTDGSFDQNEVPQVNGHIDHNGAELPDPGTDFSPGTREAVFRAIGIAQAHWALWTPFSEHRASLQTDAISSLTRAVQDRHSDDNHLRSTYALSLLLAQTREIAPAIQYLKQQLLAQRSTLSKQDQASEQKLVPLWHLLSLLLTAQQEFSKADQACAAAFENTPNFGSLSATRTARGTRRNRLGSSLSNSVGVRQSVDVAECGQLQGIIEISITEVALIEVQDGSEDAVNSCNGVLTQFADLFKRFDVGLGDLSAPRNIDPPKSSASTVKSFRGSFFGRKKLPRYSEDTVKNTPSKDTTTEKSSIRPLTQSTTTPTINVTDVDEKSPSHRHHLFRRSEDRQSVTSKQSPKTHRSHGSLSKVFRPASKDRPAEQRTPASNLSGSAIIGSTALSTQEKTQQSNVDRKQEESEGRPEHTTDDVPAPPTAINEHSQPEATRGGEATEKIESHENYPNQSPQNHTDNEFAPNESQPNASLAPTLHQIPVRFPKTTQQKHTLAFLCKIWLLISALYRRSDMFDDSREACEEATKCAQKIETIVATTEESSARAFAARGWGESRKSSDEVWADVYCERAQVSLASVYFEHEQRIKLKSRQEESSLDMDKIQEAVHHFEQCLMYFPDHAQGIVGLSNVLLDYFEKKIDLSRRIDDGRPRAEVQIMSRRSLSDARNPSTLPNGTTNLEIHGPINASVTSFPVGMSAAPADEGATATTDDDLKKTPENLNRLAARDRAYGLLSALTKLGHGWDDSEAWSALARAHELGGEIDRAKDILWWVVELEDNRPIRHWRNVSCTGYVL